MNEIQITNNIIPPRYLVFIKCANDCSFCENPIGSTYLHYISVFEKFGYLSCKSCIETGQSHVKAWKETKAHGDANKLRGHQLNIRRSSGQIESGWKLNDESPVPVENDGKSHVCCINESLDLVKMCPIEDLLELNPV